MNNVFTFLLLILAGISELTAQQPSRRYVMQNGTGDGLTWLTASGDLQAMINAAGVSEVWVAGGTYKPSGNSETSAFVLKKDVKVYGGFSGNEQELDGRPSDLGQYPSILSGDFGTVDVVSYQNGVVTISGNESNAAHVVVAAGSMGEALLDGFTVTGGNAKAGNTSRNINGFIIKGTSGGGIYLFGAAPILRNLVVTGNSALTGGGLYIQDAAPLLEKLEISRNTAVSTEEYTDPGGGGGIALYYASTDIRHTVIQENNALVDGGGIHSLYSVPVLSDVAIRRNRATRHGGGINYSSQTSWRGTPRLTDVSVTSNIAEGSGGGIYAYSNAVQMTNVEIAGNKSDVYGGGLHVQEMKVSNHPTVPTLINVVIAGNRSESGGGVSVINTQPVFTNVVIGGNRAPSYGGGAIYLETSSLFTSYTFLVRNSIITGNSSGIENGTPARGITYEFSLVQGGAAPVTSENGNIAQTTNPMFINAPDYRSAPFSNGNYRLSDCSPLINKGNNDFVGGVAVDPDGNSRINDGGTVDLGAYENQTGGIPAPSVVAEQSFAGTPTVADLVAVGANLKWYLTASSETALAASTPLAGGVYYVSQTEGGCESPRKAVQVILLNKTRYVKQDGSGDGTSWAQASNNLQAMIDETGVREVWVAGGNYAPVAKVAESGTDHHKAFLLKKNVRVLGGFSGNEAGPEERNRARSEDRSTLMAASGAYHVVIGAGDLGDATLDGFTITGGRTASDPGRIVVNGRDVEDHQGAGVYLTGVSSATVFRNLTIEANHSHFAGGGLFMMESDVKISHSAVVGNTAREGGGLAIGTGTGKPVLSEIVFSGNEASLSGAAIGSYSNAGFWLLNATIAGNSGAGSTIVFHEGDTQAVAFNTIVSGNILAAHSHSVGVDYKTSLVQGLSGPGNTTNLDGDTDPQFANLQNPAGDDGVWGTEDDGLRIVPCSPVINSGSRPDLLTGVGPALSDTDIKGNPRVFLIVDMGAYEAQVAPSAVGLAMRDTTITGRRIGSDTFYFATPCNQLVAAIHTDAPSPQADATMEASVWIDLVQPQQYVRRHFEFNQLDGEENVERIITLYFSQDDFNAFNQAGHAIKLPAGPQSGDISNVLIEKRGGVSADGTGHPLSYSGAVETLTPTSVTWDSSAGKWEVSFPTNGFSGFFLKTQLSPLPVSLVNFKVEEMEGGNQLTWKTAQEKNVAYFEVEASRDGRSFFGIGIVEAKNSALQTYSYADNRPALGITYYRLKMVDFDGSFSRSSIVGTTRVDSGTIVIHPNPVADIVYVATSNSPHDSGEVSILDITGRVVKTVLLTGAKTPIDVTNLDAGIYLMRLANGETRRWVKQ